MITSEQRRQAQQKAEATFWIVVIATLTLAACIVTSRYMPDPPSPLPVPLIEEDDE